MNDFSKLSVEQQESRLLKLAYQSLAAWGLKGELSLIKQRENAVYALKTDHGEKYALRIHRAGYHSNAALESESAWINALSVFGLGVPTIIATKKGPAFSIQEADDIDHARQIDLLAWIEGAQVGSVEDGLGGDPEAVSNIYSTIGRVAAQVHNQASQWTLPANFERHAWDTDGLVGDNPFWGKFWKLRALSETQRDLVEEARDALKIDLGSLSQAPEHYSMIHADLVPENILVEGDAVQMIDFDDAGFGWHLFELATALYFIQEDELYPVAKAALIEGYRENRVLSDEQLKHLPMFMAARSLTYLGWVHTREKTETAIEMTPTLIDMCCQAATTYLNARKANLT